LNVTKPLNESREEEPVPAKYGEKQMYEAFGVRFVIRSNEPEALERLPSFLPCDSRRLKQDEVDVETKRSLTCFSIGRTPDGFYWCLLVNRRIARISRVLGHVLHVLRGELVSHVGKLAKDRVFVHAGAVSWKGRAIVMPGDSYAGKSTLVAALIRAGATYYSDEIAVLDEHGDLHPYARPLQMREPDSAVQRSTPVARLAGKTASVGKQPMPVGLVVFSQFVKDSPWRVERLSPGLAVAHGMRHTYPVRVSPGRALQTWARTVDGAAIWAWKRGDAKQAAQELLQCLETGSLPA
jgi:hypothetical protein